MNRSKGLFWLWTGLILLLVLPWVGFQRHSHWSRVAWIPFVSSEVRITDIILNVLLYAPWGYLCMSQRPVARRVWVVVVLAAVLSLLTEATQSYSHTRFPSATDVTCNVLGAFLGSSFARSRTRSGTM